jgi:hypothetical protein
MHPNEPILKTLILMQFQVSAIDELDSDINTGNVKHLSKRLSHEIIRTQERNLKQLWKIDEETVVSVWGVYENLIDIIAKMPVDQVQFFTTVAAAALKGEVEILEEKP